MSRLLSNPPQITQTCCCAIFGRASGQQKVGVSDSVQCGDVVVGFVADAVFWVARQEELQ